MKTIEDFLQALSNTAGDTVAGPVDLLGLGLNKLGMNVGDAPVGGSEWQKRMGLRRDVEQGIPKVLGETMGLLGPALLTKFAPQIARAANQGAANLAKPQRLNSQAGKVLVGPRSEALDKAQRNAVEMLGLPPGNTPMDRAKALGFTDDVYHGTNSNVSAFDRVDGGNMWGRAHYLTDSTEDASKYATGWHNRITPAGDAGPNVMPLVAKGQMFDMDAAMKKKDIERLSKISGVKLKDYLFDAKGSSVRQALAEQTAEGPNHWLKLAGYDGIKGAGGRTPAGGAGSIQAVFQPSNIRSRFAAFDPARIKEADLLGRADPRLLGLLGLGVGGGLYLNKDD